MAQVLTVSRISYDRASPCPRFYKAGESAPNYSTDDVPDVVSLPWLIERIGVSDRSIMPYRKLAYELVPAYRSNCLDRNPNYLSRRIVVMQRENRGEKPRPVYPDPPPFERIEAVILIKIAQLFDQYKNERLVRADILRNPNFYQ